VAAAVIGGVLLVAVGALSIGEAQGAVDGATLGLLFGMMVLSAALDISGAFALVGWWITRRARSPLALLAAVSVASALLSAFLINDVVCIAFTPLVLRIADALDRSPRPYLLALATASNVGSVATVTGNPQNILIASLSHISYGRFAMFLAPVAVLALVANVGIIWLVYRKTLGGPFAVHPPEARPRVYGRWVRKSGLVMLGVLVAFVCGVPPVVAALLGASLMLLTRAVNPKRLYVRVDWTLLALFTGLFVVVAGVEKAGLADKLLRVLDPIHPESVVGLTVVTAILSNLVSNVPAVHARGQPDAARLPRDDHRRRAGERPRHRLVPRLSQGRLADRNREPRPRRGLAILVGGMTSTSARHPVQNDPGSEGS
jgi:Na+/H+ antiporter NhaD/arsenite permease-like protein